MMLHKSLMLMGKVDRGDHCEHEGHNEDHEGCLDVKAEGPLQPRYSEGVKDGGHPVADSHAHVLSQVEEADPQGLQALRGAQVDPHREVQDEH